MFDPLIYRQRREELVANLNDGLLLLPGLAQSPVNFSANPYPFRQDSSFLYYCGLNQPDMALIIDIDHSRETLCGPEPMPSDTIWSGPQPSLQANAAGCGIAHTGPSEIMGETVRTATRAGRKIHYLPAYRPDQLLILSRLLGCSPDQVNAGCSEALVDTVIAQRSVKSSEEITEIETALGLCRKLFQALLEYRWKKSTGIALAGFLEGIAKSRGSRFAFPPIITCRGDILHNTPDNNPFPPSGLLLMDFGVESREHYTSDITRTIPVSGRFTARQKAIYEIVLAAQKTVLALAAPGVRFVDLHLRAATTLCEGLRDIGLIKGAVEDAVRVGAHALFYPHGLGHMLGLDVHDMEALGEDKVGYDRETARSDQFGLAFLRLGRRLENHFVVTIEPGIYFIPDLIDQWRQDPRWSSFIAFDKLDPYRGFGGVRIEDVICITAQGCRGLGPVIPKAIATLEAAGLGGA